MKPISTSTSRKKVVVLGSGISILELSDKEKEVINNLAIKVALNKYTAFYEMSGITPSHVFFMDYHSIISKQYLQYIINIVNNKNLPITFVLNNKIKQRIYYHKGLAYYLQHLNPLNYVHFKKPILFSKKKLKTVFVDIHDHLKGGLWATEINQSLFHFRSSLTSALNFIGIVYPNSDIYLVGVDLDQPYYFFEKELYKLPFKKTDRTTKVGHKMNKHFTITNIQGTNMLDSWDYITTELKSQGCNLYSVKQDSLLVRENYVSFKSLT